jgi:hypothetical protein
MSPSSWMSRASSHQPPGRRSAKYERRWAVRRPPMVRRWVKRRVNEARPSYQSWLPGMASRSGRTVPPGRTEAGSGSAVAAEVGGGDDAPARDGRREALGGGLREDVGPGEHEAVLVLAARGGGVDLVAAEEDGAAAKARGGRPLDGGVADGLGDGAGGGVAVARVGHVVDDDLVVGDGVIVERLLGGQRLDEAVVGAGAQQRRDAGGESGLGELARIVPGHHGAARRDGFGGIARRGHGRGLGAEGGSSSHRRAGAPVDTAGRGRTRSGASQGARVPV